MYKLLSCIALSVGIVSTAAAYEPPIGIPDPGSPVYEWGNSHPISAKAPDRPSNWTDTVTGFYYVNPSSSGATDSNNTYGNPNKPRRTIPTSVSAGSYIELAGTISSSASITYKCTASNPCWIRGASKTDRPTVTGSIDVVSSSYVFIENLNFEGGSGSAVSMSGSSNHIVFRHSQLLDRAQPNGNSAGVGLKPGNGQSISDIVIYDNNFESLGNWLVTEDADFHGINPTLWGRDSTSELKNLWILNNTCSLLSGDCVQVNAGNWTESYKYLHHVYIGKNIAGKGRQIGFGVKQASDVIISQNTASGKKPTATATTGGGGGMGLQYAKDNVWYIFNEIHGSVFGIRQSDTSFDHNGASVYIIGNIIRDISPTYADNSDAYYGSPWSQGAGLSFWHGSLRRFVIDNTLHNVYDGITAIYAGDLDIQGNIISGIHDNENSNFLTIHHPATNSNVVIDHNLFFDDAGERFEMWSSIGAKSTSLAQFKTNSKGQCSNCVGADPLFVNASSNNFNLKSDSPAIGANRKHAVYDVFKDRYGIDIYVDYNGTPRHPTSPSIGAVEGGGLLSSPPAKMAKPTFQILN